MNIKEMLQAGLAAQNAGKLDEAERVYRAIQQQAPRDSNAHHLLGVIFRDRGKYEQAIACITTAIVLDSRQAVYYNNLGTCYLRKKEHVAAEALFRYALACKNDYADALSNLGLALRELQRWDDAIAVLRQALVVQPDSITALCTLGNVYQQQKQLPQGLECYEQALQLQPSYAPAVLGKSEVLFDLERYEEALPLADRVCELDRSLIPEAVQVKAQSLQIMGKMDEACAALDFGLSASPGSIELAYIRAQLRKVRKDEPFYAQLQRYGDRLDTVRGMPKARAAYALGKSNEDVGEMAKASHFYAIGAQAVREGRTSDERSAELLYEVIAKTCTSEYLAGLEGMVEGSERPIFILGMPRSGTTLTEQILASHPDVVPQGELMFAQEVLDQYLFPGKYKMDNNADPNMDMHTPLRERGRLYLEKLHSLRPTQEGRYATDKMPGNFKLLGLIAAMLPHARIIHCRRDPIDNCISCYTQLFTTGHDWSFDLAALGRQYRRYWKLMEHWRQALPGRFLEVRYEELVENTQEGAQKILKWCDLDWNDQVLRFYETNRPVKTASLTQVRQPIYTTSTGRWKKWEPYIQPLLAEIGDIEKQYWAEVGL
jgi:tetratricopeptide (TPR) repeat protein